MSSELQTMPLRFRVWSEEEKRFFTIKDAFPNNRLPEEDANSIIFKLPDLAELVNETLYFESYDSYIVSQDTGSVDKNDKPIFTGDIVRVKDFGGDIVGIVECHYGECRIHYKNGLEESLVFNFGCEVIGNIWEGVNNE